MAAFFSLRHWYVRVGLILLLAALGGLVANTLHPRRLPLKGDWSHRIEAEAAGLKVKIANLDQARYMIKAGKHIVFDARAATDFEAGHIANAISLPAKKISESFPQVQVLLTPDQPILVYCSGRECDESLAVARFLREQGYNDVTVFPGGFKAWAKAGLKLETGP